VAQSVMNGRAITTVTGAYTVGRPVWRNTSKADLVLRGIVNDFYCFGGAVAASGAAAVGDGAASKSAETSTLPEVTFILRSHIV